MDSTFVDVCFGPVVSSAVFRQAVDHKHCLAKPFDLVRNEGRHLNMLLLLYMDDLLDARRCLRRVFVSGCAVL